MPRHLLLDGLVVEDGWRELGEDPLPQAGAWIIGFERWQRERSDFVARGGLLGVKLEAAHRVEDLAPDLPLLSLVAANFPGPSDGRGYTQARLLRERHGFKGEVRACGYVRRDQVFFLARCGFNALELPAAELASAEQGFLTFSAAYQASNDTGLPARLLRR